MSPSVPPNRMRISAATPLNKALDLDPKVVDYIISLNPHDFERLRVPFMRRILAPRVTLGRVAQMTGVPVDELLARVAVLGGGQVDAGASQPNQSLPLSSQARPDWATEADLVAERDVDLLPIDQTLDADPLPLVMRVIHALQSGQVMRFKHKWEPQPFYDLWTRLGGLEWFSEQRGPDAWWVWVRRTS